MSDTARLLDGRYQTGELIGRGGMADVYLGRDTRLGRTVAIKLMRPDLAQDQAFVNRFTREAQSAASLNQPSIVAVYDHGEDHFTDSAGRKLVVPYIIMEYVDGQTVREILKDHPNGIDPIQAALITESVLDALAYSHRAGIVHRDIKPANVMIGRTGSVKVMDFGIARAMADSAATMTQTQAVLGTAQYLSPEQAQGMPVDERSDLYSTGCLLFEMLTGRAPFVGESPVSIAYQHVGQAPPRPSTLNAKVPADMDDIVAYALAKDRDARYPTAVAFRADLDSFRKGQPISDAASGAAAAAVSNAATGRVPISNEEPTQVIAPAPERARPVPARAIPDAYREVDDYEDEPEPSRRWAWALLGLGVVAALAAGIYVFTQLSNNNEVATASVPNVVGMTNSNAKSLLESQGFTVTETLDDQSDKPKDEVIKQDPLAGQNVTQGSIVTLTVSSGPQTIAVPSVQGLSVEDATKILEDKKLKVNAKTKSKDDTELEEGRVDSTDPPANSAVQEGDSITLVVSSGKVTVPDITNLSLAAAEKKLIEAGLTLGGTKEVEDDSKKAGTVISQKPASGPAKRGSAVDVVVAKKPEPTPTTPPTTGSPSTPPTLPPTP